MTTPAEEPLASVIRDDRRVIFINLVILDASDAVDAQLSKKLKGVPKPLAKAATKMATTMVTPERVAQALAKEMPTKLVEKMASKGLTAAAELAFVEGPYVVVQLQIQSVSAAAMIEAQSNNVYDDDGEIKEKAKLDKDLAARIQAWWAQFLALIGVQHQKSLEEEYLPRLIQSKMETMLGEVMAGKLQDKGMQAMSQVLPEEKQGRFFFKTLRELRQVKESMKPAVRVAGAVAVARSNVQERAAKARSNVQQAASNMREGAKQTVEKLKPKFPGKKVV